MDDNSLTPVSVPPPPPFESIQYVEQPEFMTLGLLVDRERIAHGVLATAIETHGIQGWDRFGRLETFIAGSPGANDALDVLARHYATADDRSERRAFDREYADWEEFALSPYDDYGWYRDVLPEFTAIQADDAQHPQKPPPNRKGKPDANLAIIGSLLLLVKGELGVDPHPVYETETALIDLLKDKMRGYPGMSIRNLQDKFAAAKRAIG